MRALLPLAVVIIVVLAVAGTWWAVTRDRRRIARDTPWEMYSQPVGENLVGWEVGVHRRHAGKSQVNMMDSWAAEPFLADRIASEEFAKMRAQEFNEARWRD